MDRRICVISTGACTAVGLTVASAAAAVRAGIAGFREHPTAMDMIDEPAIVARAPTALPDAPMDERLERLVLVALTDALQGVGNAADYGPLPVIVALPEPRPGFDTRLADALTARLSERMRGRGTVLVLPHGHAGGGFALEHAIRRLTEGQWGWAAIAGVDSYISPETVAWLDGGRQLHAAYNAWGFIPGEAAGVCVIATVAAARTRNTRALALVEQVAVEREAVPIKADGVCLGWALTRATRRALANLAADEAVDRIYCDQNGEPYRADELGFMLVRLAERFRNPGDFVAPADCWGDVGAASVPLLVGLVTAAAERGYAAGPLSLVLAGSESGHRTCILLRTPAGRI